MVNAQFSFAAEGCQSPMYSSGTVTSALNCMLFSPGSQYHRFEAVQPSFFSSDPVLYSYVKMMFMQRMNKKNGTDIVCEQ